MTLKHSRFPLGGMIFLVAGGLLILLAIGAYQVFLPSFAELERKEMVRNLHRVQEQLTNEIGQLTTIAADYSGWDEAYDFVRKGDSKFIKANLDDAIFSELRLDFLIYLDSSEKICYSKFFTSGGDREMPLPTALLNRLRTDFNPQVHPSLERKKGGILSLPEGYLLVASHPVLKSDFTGPATGMLAMGRYFDSFELQRLANTLHLSVDIIPVDDGNDSPSFAAVLTTLQTGGNDYLVIPGENTVDGYILFRDVGGEPAFLARVVSPRDIYQGGLTTIQYFLFLAILVAIITGTIIFFLICRRQELASRYRTLVHNAAEGIVLLEPGDFRIIEANEAFVRFIGGHAANTVGRSFLGWIPMEPNAARENLLRAFSGKREVSFRHEDGSLLVAELLANHIRLRGMEAIVLIVHDVTDRRQLEEQLVHQANHDALTGLPNRNLLGDRLQQGLALAARQQHCLTVALIDLDNFKLVNDRSGHAAGDRLLVAVAGRLRACCRVSDTLARLGGDEFVFLSVCARAENAIRFAENIQKAFAEPFSIDNLEVHVAATIGIAQYPEDGSTGEELMRKADLAMYHVKSAGKNGFAFFREDMNQILEERTAILAQLRNAIERKELELYYQPKISLADGTICGQEALLRWHNSELGKVSPASFIPIAEESGLILPIGEWVLRTAASQLMRWRNKGVPVTPVAVNISARQFADPRLVECIENILQQTGLEAGMLQLELTETMIMRDVDESIRRMFQLKELGIGLAVDDFGTGHSSLAYISQFPIECLKIDRTFVAGIEDDPVKKSIVRTIIVMAHGLGLKVVAEGVETMAQMEFVRSQKCEEFQGYLFSMPVPAEEVEKLLCEWTARYRGEEAESLLLPCFE